MIFGFEDEWFNCSIKSTIVRFMFTRILGTGHGRRRNEIVEVSIELSERGKKSLQLKQSFVCSVGCSACMFFLMRFLEQHLISQWVHFFSSARLRYRTLGYSSSDDRDFDDLRKICRTSCKYPFLTANWTSGMEMSLNESQCIRNCLTIWYREVDEQLVANLLENHKDNTCCLRWSPQNLTQF